MSEDFRELCNRYIESLDQEFDESEINELDNQISELKEERQKYIQDYGEDDVLVENVDEDLVKLTEEREKIEESLNTTDELEQEILERTSSEFIAEGEYLSQPVLEALCHIFTGERRSRLMIEDYEITSEGEIEEDIRRVSHVVRKLALAKLGEDTSIEDSWEKIAEGKRLPPFVVVANAQDPLSPSKVAERMESDVDSGKVGNNLRNAIHKLEYPPYHRIDGDYTLSTIGKLMALDYGDGLDKMRQLDSESSNESANDEGQSTLESA